MILAMMIENTYPDLFKDELYEINRLFSDGHFKIGNRRYFKKGFMFFKDGKKVSYREAYMFQGI